jgi:polyketide biosynthesis enoyl-CoA hydratase PksH
VIRVEAAGAVLRLTLDRAERQNAIDQELIDALQAALDEAERSATCRIVVLQGSGGVFCTGMDMAVAGDEQRGPGEDPGGRAFFALLRRLTAIPRVVVASVDGRAVAGGVGLMAASDLVYATERSTFSLPEALWGLLPCCVLPFLIRRVGFQKAYSMTLSTLPVTADEARRVHLVDEVTGSAEALVHRLAFRVTKLDDVVLGDLKRYFARLHPISQEVEETAVSELARLMASPAVRDRTADFAANRRLPWERPPGPAQS